MIDVFIFDLDGVIIDSSADLAFGVNEMLVHFGFAPLPEKTLISFVGNGARKLVERALFASSHGKIGADFDKFEEALLWYVAFYFENPVKKTILYPRVRFLLENLQNRGKKNALLTNKPAKIAKKILDILDVSQFFDSVAGPELILQKKPAPDGIFYSLEQINKKYCMNYTTKNAIMIGDSAVDMQAGKSAHCLTAGVTGGLGNKEKLIFEKPDIILNFAGDLIEKIDWLDSL